MINRLWRFWIRFLFFFFSHEIPEYSIVLCDRRKSQNKYFLFFLFHFVHRSNEEGTPKGAMLTFTIHDSWLSGIGTNEDMYHNHIISASSTNHRHRHRHYWLFQFFMSIIMPSNYYVEFKKRFALRLIDKQPPINDTMIDSKHFFFCIFITNYDLQFLKPIGPWFQFFFFWQDQNL